MIRKWMTALLSLLLAVMLPLCGLAQTQHTLTIVPGDMLASEPAVADLLDVLSLTVTSGKKSGALTLTLDGADIATVAIGADVTGLYAHSNLLGSDVLYVTWDDAFALIKDMMRAELMNESVDSAGISSVLEQMDQAKEQIVAALGSGVVVSSSVMTQEEMIAQAKEMFKDDPEMQAYLKGIYEKMTVENGFFTDEARDAADQKHNLTLSEEDMKALVETRYMYQMIWDSLLQSDPDLTGDDLAEMTETTLAEMRKLFENSDMEVTVNAYTLDEGETLVGMDMLMNMTVTDEDVSETVNMVVDYDRLTDAEGVNYTAEMDMGIDGESMMKMLFDFNRGTDAVSEGMLAFLVEGEELSITYHAENLEADVRERNVGLYLRSGAVNIIEPAASDRPLIAFKVTTSPADPAVLAAIEAADASNSVDVLKLSDEEMQGLVSSISANLMQAMYGALAKLPASTLTMFLGAGE